MTKLYSLLTKVAIHNYYYCFFSDGVSCSLFMLGRKSTFLFHLNIHQRQRATIYW